MLTDEIAWGEALEGLQLAAKIVGSVEVGEMAFKLLMIVLVIALDGRVLDRSVHPLDLTIRRASIGPIHVCFFRLTPWMVDLSEAIPLCDHTRDPVH